MPSQNGIKTSISIVSMSCVLLFSSASHAFTNANDQLDFGMDLYDSRRFENASDAFYELVVARDFRRLDATEKTLALNHLIYSLLNQGKPEEAQRHVANLLNNTQSGFGKRSEMYVEALLTQALVQYRLGKNRDAVRTTEEMVDILDRLGDEYARDVKEVKMIASQIRDREWNDEELPKDLSDFYTTCEKVQSGANVPGVTRSFSDYILVGTDYTPTGRMRKAFKTTYVKSARENAKDRANRLIFIPDEDHQMDWCVVYPDGRVVDRAVTVPPEA